MGWGVGGLITRRKALALVAVAAGAAVLPRQSPKQALAEVMAISRRGTVRMEDLRFALSDRLPELLEGSAQALGVSVAELLEMVREGNLKP